MERGRVPPFTDRQVRVAIVIYHDQRAAITHPVRERRMELRRRRLLAFVSEQQEPVGAQHGGSGSLELHCLHRQPGFNSGKARP